MTSHPAPARPLAALFACLALLGLLPRPTAAETTPPAAPLDVRVTVELDASRVEPQLRDLQTRLGGVEARLEALERPLPMPEPPASRAAPFLGVNVMPPRYYGSAWVYGDVLQQAKFQNGSWWAFVDVPNRAGAPAAGYLVEPAGAATVRAHNTRIEIKAGEDARRSGVQVYLPGATLDSLFHPLFTERLEPFRVLRFMDWTSTNNSGKVSWADENAAGSPLGHAVALANELGADMWVCVPHQANEEYVRHLAGFLKERLRPGLKVYLEYSNEVWNGAFKQYHWVKKLGESLPEVDKHPLHAGWVSRMREVFGWAGEVFADQPGRLVRVVAGQQGNPWHVKRLTELLGAGNFDAVSCGWYTYADDMRDDVTPGEILDQLRAGIDKREPKWREHKAIADRYGVPLLGYEGGQHLTPHGKTPGWYDAYVAAQRSAGMADVYAELIRRARGAGFSLLVHYADVAMINKWGAWGLLEYQSQPVEDAPKYRAVLEAAAER